MEGLSLHPTELVAPLTALRKRTRRGKRKATKPTDYLSASRTKRSKRGKKRKRAAQKDHTEPRDYKPTDHALSKINNLAATTLNVSDLPAARGASIGKRQPVATAHAELSAYVDAGAKIFQWNGLYVFQSAVASCVSD